MINIAVIVNPASGKGSGSKFLKTLEDTPIPSNIKLTKYITEYRTQATEFASEIANHFDRIIIAGGDGTINEFLNGYNSDLRIPIGLIPIGSGNDFAITFSGDHSSIIKNIDYFLQSDLKYRQVDVGNVVIRESNGKIIEKKFINSLGIGFDARVAYLNQTNKFFSGSMSYIFAILRAFMKMTQIGFEVKIDGKYVFSKNALFCSIGNGECVGGGLYLTSGARIDDGFLDLSIVQLDSRLKLLILLPKASANNLIGVKELKQWKFKNLEIDLETPYYTHVDGEMLSAISKNVKVNVLKNSLKIII